MLKNLMRNLFILLVEIFNILIENTILYKRKFCIDGKWAKISITHNSESVDQHNPIYCT